MASRVYYCYGKEGCGQRDRDCGPLCSYTTGLVAAPANGRWGQGQGECPGNINQCLCTPLSFAQPFDLPGRGGSITEPLHRAAGPTILRPDASGQI